MALLIICAIHKLEVKPMGRTAQRGVNASARPTRRPFATMPVTPIAQAGAGGGRSSQAATQARAADGSSSR
eukprot:4584208-Pyramimonas_sp.AAC.1